jgi:hypothetical protein
LIRWVRLATSGLAGALAVLVTAVAIGRAAWTRQSARLVSRLTSALPRERQGADPYDPARVPAPVARYFAFALPPGQAAITAAHLRFDGTFAAKPNVWSPFTADQRVHTDPPGFVWDARITMARATSVYVRDSYTGGVGAMEARLAGVFPLVDQHGTPEMASASLMRFLAEAVWYPTALLPRAGLSWSEIDDSTARVTVTDGLATASLQVQFGPSGEITTVSGMRYRDVKGVPVLTPWIGHHASYQRVANMMIPTTGEVGWGLATGVEPYWRGRLVFATYELAQPF